MPATAAFPLAARLTLAADPDCQDPCYRYACAELTRLLARLGVAVERRAVRAKAGFALGLGGKPPRAATSGISHDGYRISVDAGGVALAATQAKGVLNAVYDLAERLGFVFLLPTEEWEWAPSPAPAAIPGGSWLRNPRFAHRGVFWQLLASCRDFSREDWLRFHAKLRFNAVAHDVHPGVELCAELGLRPEIGGHGLSALLPRALAATRPELFRMAQPEDFGGKRVGDYNFCPTNPATKALVKQAFSRRIAQSEGAYAVHAWADDLPGGGWCLCPSCRSLPATDQAMLATRHLAEAVRESGRAVRVPLCAYHDTMFPGRVVKPPPEAFYLFAPRERCYGHALDDHSCPLNRRYLAALKDWQEVFAGNDDAHVFEYYFDQILFRGLYPFLPGTILRDLAVYERHGIATCLSLQVAGPEIAPELNLLLFSQAQWDRRLTADGFIAGLARRMPEAGAAWPAYLAARARVFARAMRLCGHTFGIYMDYRWLPENDSAFGRAQATSYARAGKELARAARALRIPGRASARVRRLLERERARGAFEAAELAVMAEQQAGSNALGRWCNSGAPADLAAGTAALRRAVEALVPARAAAQAFGLADDTWYMKNINQWLTGEMERKIARYAAPAGSP